MMTPTSSHPIVVPLDERELLRQERVRHLLLDTVGGSLRRQQVMAQHLTTVLDVACGTGTWALDIATLYPFLHVTGIDGHAPSIAYAQRLADERALNRV